MDGFTLWFIAHTIYISRHSAKYPALFLPANVSLQGVESLAKEANQKRIVWLLYSRNILAAFQLAKLDALSSVTQHMLQHRQIPIDIVRFAQILFSI